MIKCKFIRVKKALTKSGLYDVDYSLNPYLGCEHGCIYCYALHYSPKDVRNEWSRLVLVKKNIDRLLIKEVKKLSNVTIYLSSITDPYQPIENELKLTRKCLEILSKFNNIRISIQTKSSLILRDLDIISKLHKVDIGVTITTLDDDIASILEPKASKPKDRALILKKFSLIGIETWIFMGPIIPLYTDNEDNIESIVKLASETNSVLIYDKLRLKPLVIKRIYEYLDNANKVIELAKDNTYWLRIFKIIKNYCEKFKVKCTYSMTI